MLKKSIENKIFFRKKDLKNGSEAVNILERLKSHCKDLFFKLIFLSKLCREWVLLQVQPGSIIGEGMHTSDGKLKLCIGHKFRLCCWSMFIERGPKMSFGKS